MKADWIDHHSNKSLQRLLPRLDDIFGSRPGAIAAHRRQAFEERLHRHWDPLFRLPINLRKSPPALYDGGMEVIDTGNPHLFGYTRQNADQHLLVVNNFSETPQTMNARALKAGGCGRSSTNLITGTILATEAALELGSYGFVWLDCSAPSETGGNR
jgi:glycosidase